MDGKSAMRNGLHAQYVLFTMNVPMWEVLTFKKLLSQVYKRSAGKFDGRLVQVLEWRGRLTQSIVSLKGRMRMYIDLTLQHYLNDLASSQPTPGVVSASALCGAMSASLACMVCLCTVDTEEV